MLTAASSDANDLEELTAVQFFIWATKWSAHPFYHARSEVLVIERYFCTQSHYYANCNWEKFRKKCLPKLNNWQMWHFMLNGNLEEGDLLSLIEDSDKRMIIPLIIQRNRNLILEYLLNILHN